MSQKFFTIKNNKVSKELSPTNEVERMINKAAGLRFDSEANFKDYLEVDYGQDYDTGIQYEYNIKFGSFVEWQNGHTLEAIFESMEDMLKDMLQFSLEELEDIIYSPYIEIKEEALESDTSQYDTLNERWGLT